MVPPRSRPSSRRAWSTVAAAATALLVLPIATADAAPPRPGPRPAPTTTTTTAPAPTCGTTIRKADGTPWVCTFADEFSGTTLDRRKWVPQQTATSGYTSGGECFVDNAQNVSVANGALNLTVRSTSAPFTCTSPFGNYTSRYTSGMVSTWGLFSQAYGRFEIRARVADVDVPGLHSGLWLFPQSSAYGAWPASGEIDIAEMFSQYPDRAIPYVHYNGDASDPNATNNWCMLDPSQWHTYVLEWTPTTLTVSYDGVVCIVDRWAPTAPQTAPQPFDQPFVVILTQSVGLGTNAPTWRTPLPATTQVDYVRVWQ